MKTLEKLVLGASTLLFGCAHMQHKTSVLGVEIYPLSPTENVDLLCSAFYSSLGKTVLSRDTFEFSWYRNGQLVFTERGEQGFFPHEYTSFGDSILCSISSEYVSSVPLAEAEREIGVVSNK